MRPDFTSVIFPIVLGYAVLDGGGWFVQVNATTCTATSGYFCPTTLFSTGVCGGNGNCICVTGFSPDKWGCRKDLEVPVIELLDKNAVPYGSEGAKFTLVCTPSDMTSYVWRYQGSVVDGETSSTLFVAPNIADSPHGYTCQYTFSDQTSNESANFDINIIIFSQVGLGTLEPFTVSQIVGMPTTLVGETLLTLTCTTQMKVLAYFEWEHSLTSAMVSDDTIVGVASTANQNSPISCFINYYDGSEYFDAESPIVWIPMISDNIPGVHIAEGDRFVVGGDPMNLTCVFNEDDFLSDGLSITWEWFVNNTQVNTSGQIITVDAVDSALHQGEWKCAATYEDQPTRESSVISVYVDASAPNLMINNTEDSFDFAELYELTCEIDSDYAVRGVEINFYEDGILMTSGEADSMFVTGNITDSNFTCDAAFNGIFTNMSNSIIVSLGEVFEFVQVESASKIVTSAIDSIVNTEVTLLCQVGLLPDLPDLISYTWFAGDMQVDGEDMLDFNVTQEGDVIVYCVANLGSHFQSSSNNVTVTGHALEAPVLSLLNGNSDDSLDFSQTYYLRCQVNALFASFGLEYEFLRDGIVIHSGINNAYQIPNDVRDRQYTCIVFLQNQASPVSNSVNITFEVFDAVDVVESLRCHVRSTIDPTYLSTLTCNVTLLAGVPNQINYTWQDANNTDVSSASTYSIFVTEDVNITMTCQAEVGSHVESVTVTHEISSNDITLPCSAPSLHLSFTMLVLAFVLACCHFVY